MTDTPVEIPDRAAFRAAEVCEIVQIPPYVLRSWEKEFPGLGAAARPGGPRIYRRSDVEQILRIKQLVFAEGLTLAGVRHRIAGDPAEDAEAPVEDAPVGVPAEVRNRVAEARRELRALLEMLSERPVPAPAGDAQAGAPGGAAAADVRVPNPEPGAAVRPQADADLPLLNGVLDTPPKPRRGRRAAKQAPWGAPGEVE